MSDEEDNDNDNNDDHDQDQDHDDDNVDDDDIEKEETEAVPTLGRIRMGVRRAAGGGDLTLPPLAVDEDFRQG